MSCIVLTNLSFDVVHCVDESFVSCRYFIEVVCKIVLFMQITMSASLIRHVSICNLFSLDRVQVDESGYTINRLLMEHGKLGQPESIPYPVEVIEL